MNKLPIVIVVLMLIAVFLVVFSDNQKNIDNGQQISCTMDAKLCPDGSYVGRSGPQCQFATCPSATSTPATTTQNPPVSTETESVIAAINQTILQKGIHILPLELVEDSRCPADVQCIQAGTVRVRVQLESGGKNQTLELSLGKPVTFGGTSVTLVAVNPEKNSKTTISQSQYRFRFSVTR